MRIGGIDNPRVRLVRFIIITASVCLLDVLVVLLARRPIPWAVAIPWLIPVLVVAWIVVPMRQARKR